MTEREKMLKGELYDSSDVELVAMRRKARNLAIAYSSTYDEEEEKRKRLLDELFCGQSANMYVETPLRVDYGCHTRVGENFYANFHLTILDCAPVTIGDNVMLGPNVTLATPCHPLLAIDRNIRRKADGTAYDYEYAKPISIGNNVWIASNVVVCGGVTIGDDVVIGAGSVVTRDIPSGVIAVGNPCKVLRKLTDRDKMKLPNED